jgi:hypothetical protein
VLPTPRPDQPDVRARASACSTPARRDRLLSISGADISLNLIGHTDTLTFSGRVSTDFNAATDTLAIDRTNSVSIQPLDSFRQGGSTAYSAASFIATGMV